jgi:hypothetical protein
VFFIFSWSATEASEPPTAKCYSEPSFGSVVSQYIPTVSARGCVCGEEVASTQAAHGEQCWGCCCCPCQQSEKKRSRIRTENTPRNETGKKEPRCNGVNNNTGGQTPSHPPIAQPPSGSISPPPRLAIAANLPQHIAQPHARLQNSATQRGVQMYHACSL